MNPSPEKLLFGGVSDNRYLPNKLASDLEGAQTVLNMLRNRIERSSGPGI